MRCANCSCGETYFSVDKCIIREDNVSDSFVEKLTHAASVMTCIIRPYNYFAHF